MDGSADSGWGRRRIGGGSEINPHEMQGIPTRLGMLLGVVSCVQDRKETQLQAWELDGSLEEFATQ